MKTAVRDLDNGIKLYPVWLHQAYHSLSAKYKRTIFGTLWIAGNFVFTSIAITIVFGALFHQNLHDFLPYSMLGNLCGTLCLYIFSEAPEMYISSGSIIKNHSYPKTYFAFESVARLLMLFGHNLVVFYVFMLINGSLSIPDWSILPGLILNIISLFTWGTIVGMAAARFRDLRFLLPNLANLFFFLTPIYWHVDMLGPHAWIANVNPLYNMVSIMREPLMGRSASALNWEYCVGIAASGLGIWLITFISFRKRIPFWV